MVEDVVGPFVGHPVVAHRSIMRYDAEALSVLHIQLDILCSYGFIMWIFH